MQLQLIRNATMRLTYNGRLILTDPFFAGKDTLPPFGGRKGTNPLVDLPMPPEEVIAGAEMVLVSHLHPDHFDDNDKNNGVLPKDILLYCQPGDGARIREYGFTQVTEIADAVEWGGISITKTTGNHGRSDWPVSGFILRAVGEPTVYWMGDTIWYDEVEQIVTDVQPDIIITHSSGARTAENILIVMDSAQTVAVCKAAPEAIVIAIHLDSLNHGTVSREDLRIYADADGISSEQLRIPADGEILVFNA
ncbi:MAG: Zn-dependent hydrolase [Phototrophicales bacterium]|nr:MAG: Zn-dependent hydrolase [Phototrophicales bacterium]